MKKIIILVFLSMTILLVSCGQKGALYLPKKLQGSNSKKTNTSWYVGGETGINNT